MSGPKYVFVWLLTQETIPRLIWTAHLPVIRKIKFFHTACGKQECSHEKNIISFFGDSCFRWKGNACTAEQHSSYVVAFLVLKTKCERPQLPSCVSLPLQLINTRGPEYKVTKWRPRGSSLQDMSISPEIHYLYLGRDSTSGILI